MEKGAILCWPLVEAQSVREFAEAAFSHVDLDWKEFVRHDPRYERPAGSRSPDGRRFPKLKNSQLGTKSAISRTRAKSAFTS
jgi:hypothetical protein